MNSPTQHVIECTHAGAQPGTHRMAYYRWGSADCAHVVVCVHGISRQAMDFQCLARHLLTASAGRCQVIAVDVAGRGDSDWLEDWTLYQVPQYASDLMALLADLKLSGAQIIDWVGTSMGGLIGMAVAAQTALRPELSSLMPRRLVLNDVGPVIEWAALQRIGSYLGADLRFKTEQEAIDYMWEKASSFGPHTPEQWRALCLPQMRADGALFRLHFDPRIVKPVQLVTPESAAAGEALLWQAYAIIRSETLLIRGAQSDLLSKATAQAMTLRGPKAKLVEFEGVGHAPTLLQADQMQVVQEFLLA